MPTTKSKRPASPTEQPQPKRAKSKPPPRQETEDDTEDGSSEESEGTSEPEHEEPEMDHDVVVQALMKANEENQNQGKEVKDFGKAATKSRYEILEFLTQQQEKISTIEDDYREIVKNLFQSTATPGESSQGKFSPGLQLRTLQLNERHLHALDSSKDLLNSFDRFIEEVKVVESTENAASLKGKWAKDDAEMDSYLKAGRAAARVKVDECLRRPGEKDVESLDAKVEEDGNVLFRMAKEGRANGAEVDRLTMGVFVRNAQRYTEKVVGMLPEHLD